MRASSAHNQRYDRERLIFAVCHKCEKVTAVYVAEGQDLAAILLSNKLRPVGSNFSHFIPVECVNCYEVKPPIPWREQIERQKGQS